MPETSDRAPRITLIANASAVNVPGGVSVRWQALAGALHAREAGFATVHADALGGCGLGCEAAAHVAAAPSGDPFAAWFCPIQYESLLRHLAENGTEIAVFTNIHMHEYARRLAERGTCRVVYDMHNVEFALTDELAGAVPEECRGAFGIGRDPEAVRRAEQAVLDAVDQVWTCSADDLELAVEVYGWDLRPKFRVVPTGVPVAEVVPVVPWVRHAIFTGRFDYYPNYEAGTRLVRRIAPLAPHRTVMLAGAAARILESGGPLPENVALRADPQATAPLIGRGVMAVPLRLGGGTRIKILEAMAVGAPVVSSRKGAEGLGLTPGSHYLEAESDAEFAEAIDALLGDEALRMRLTVQALEFVRGHNSPRTVAAVLGEHLSLL